MAASPESPVLDALAAMTAESVARCGQDANSLLAARIAALCQRVYREVSHVNRRRRCRRCLALELIARDPGGPDRAEWLLELAGGD
jgi:hypothetical protein